LRATGASAAIFLELSAGEVFFHWAAPAPSPKCPALAVPGGTAGSVGMLGQRPVVPSDAGANIKSSFTNFSGSKPVGKGSAGVSLVGLGAVTRRLLRADR